MNGVDQMTSSQRTVPTGVCSSSNSMTVSIICPTTGTNTITRNSSEFITQPRLPDIYCSPSLFSSSVLLSHHPRIHIHHVVRARDVSRCKVFQHNPASLPVTHAGIAAARTIEVEEHDLLHHNRLR